MVVKYSCHFCVMRIKDLGSSGSCILVDEIFVGQKLLLLPFLNWTEFKNKAGEQEIIQM